MSAGVLYAWKGVHTLFTGQRERERERERVCLYLKGMTSALTRTNFSLQDEPWSEFSTLEVAACNIMHLLPSVAIQPNLGLKTPPKQLLGSLPLVIALPKRVPFQLKNN